MSDVMDVGSRAQVLLRSTLVWDNHACMPLRTDARFLPQLERYRNAGVDVVSLNVGFAEMSWAEHLQVLSFIRRWVALRPDDYCLVSAAEDVRRCRESGKLGIVFDIEGMCPVQDNLSLVQTFYELGVRWMSIAYNRGNAAGGGCLGADEGLTALGRSIIDEMQRVGMVLCLSHTGARTASEALEYSSRPAIFSHSNPHGDTAHVRNISDELMLACARKGGVVGLSGIGPYMGVSSSTAGTRRLLQQLRYVIDLVGAQHVALGLDYVFDRTELDDYVRATPGLFPGLDMVGGLPMIEPEAMIDIAEGLAVDNLSDEQIRCILGGNWLRIATLVWR